MSSALDSGGVRWNDREVVELLNIWGDRNVQSHLKRTFRNHNIFEDIAEALREKGISKTAEQCRLKIKKFKSKYRSLREQYESCPKSFARKAWQYYSLMDTIMNDQPVASDTRHAILRASLQKRGVQRGQEQTRQTESSHFLSGLLNAPKDTPGTSEASWPAVNSAQVVQRLKAGDTLNAPHSLTQRDLKPILPKPSTSAMTPPYLESQLSPQPVSQPRPQTTKQAQRPQQRPPKLSPAHTDGEDSEPQQVCLRWNSFHSNMETMFPALLYKEKFVDVTLACEGRVVKCHKVVLSSCSPYLDRLLSDNPCKHPIILMPKDVPYWALRAIVEFMYRGEVNVEHEQLAPLLAAAESLQIKGLAGDTGKQPERQAGATEGRPAVKRKRIESPAQPQQKQQTQSNSSQPSTSTQQPSQPQPSTLRKEKDSPPRKRPQMAPHIAESLRGLSPGIEITPLVTFEEIKTEPADADDSNDDDGSLENNEQFGLGKGYDDGEESLPVSHVESLVEEDDGDDGEDENLNDHSQAPDPSDLLSTEMDHIEEECDDSVNVYGENGMDDFNDCGLVEAPDIVESYEDVAMHNDPEDDSGS